jgi:hypothetical protein
MMDVFAFVSYLGAANQSGGKPIWTRYWSPPEFSTRYDSVEPNLSSSVMLTRILAGDWWMMLRDAPCFAKQRKRARKWRPFPQYSDMVLVGSADVGVRAGHTWPLRLGSWTSPSSGGTAVGDVN